MSRTITIPDGLYERLEFAARTRGLKSIEQLLERWSSSITTSTSFSEEELQRRKEAVDRIDAIYEQMSRKYGTMPDSVDLIREDRER